jgi:hypothetical protein
MIKITNKKTEKPHVPQKIIEQPTRKVMQLCKDMAYIEKELKKNNIEQKIINRILCLYVLFNK